MEEVRASISTASLEGSKGSAMGAPVDTRERERLWERVDRIEREVEGWEGAVDVPPDFFPVDLGDWNMARGE